MGASSLWRGSVLQKLRLVSGLILFAFATAHFLNHALGLVSLDAMTTFDGWRLAVTHSAPGASVLVAALLVHAGLGVWPALRRRSWAIPLWEWGQILTGVLIPLLLLPHVVGTTLAARLFGVHPTYPYELARIWTATILDQSALLLVVWVHGCIGLHFWLRLSPHYAVAKPVLYAGAVLLPFAALAGISVQGRAVEAATADPAAAAALKTATAWPDAAATSVLEEMRDDGRIAYMAGLGVLAIAIAGGTLLAGRGRRIRVRYVGGPELRTEPGATLLEVSRRNGVPHVSVCGGRGRCSTCRVLVLDKGRGVGPAQEDERRTLAAIGAGPHVRLACQAVATGDVTLLPLLKATPGAAAPGGEPPVTADGVERDLAALSVDLRGFTALTERKLPFDVIYILNQFFNAIGQPVHDLGGWIANYAGDGIIALFADERGLDGACRSALLAAARIDGAVAALSDRLMEETRVPLRVAMGLHAGPHVMGRVGFGATQPTAVVGLAVNVASRLENLAKQNGVQLALSRTVAAHGGLDTDGLTSEAIEVRGLSAPLDVVFVAHAGILLARIGGRGSLDRLVLT